MARSKASPHRAVPAAGKCPRTPPAGKSHRIHRSDAELKADVVTEGKDVSTAAVAAAATAAATAVPPAASRHGMGQGKRIWEEAADEAGDADEDVPAAGIEFVGSTEPPRKRRRFFTKEVAHMMYGFGDTEEPLSQSVLVAEDLVCEFLATLSSKAVQNCVQYGSLRKGAFKVQQDRETKHKKWLKM